MRASWSLEESPRREFTALAASIAIGDAMIGLFTLGAVECCPGNYSLNVMNLIITQGTAPPPPPPSVPYTTSCTLRVTFPGVVHQRVSRERHGHIKASVSRQ